MKPRVVRIIEFALLAGIVYFVLLAVTGCKREPKAAAKEVALPYPCAMGGSTQRPLAAPTDIAANMDGADLTVPKGTCLSWRVGAMDQGAVAEVVIQCQQAAGSLWYDAATILNPDMEAQVWVIGSSATCPKTRFKTRSYSAGLVRVAPIVGDPEATP